VRDVPRGDRAVQRVAAATSSAPGQHWGWSAVWMSPIPVSTPCHCPPVNLRANPAAAVEPNPGTGASTCPAASARWRSNPTKKSSPTSCAAAIPTSNCPPVNPRSRTSIGPTVASNSPIMSRRSTNSVTATVPDTGANDRSGAPTHTRRRNRPISRTLPT